MASTKLPNYVRVHRKRLGLSQHDVAFLLGGRDDSQASRYEHFSRTPTLRTALALAIIFRASMHELFSGEYEAAKNTVCRRALELVNRLSQKACEQATARKLVELKRILSTDDNRA